MKNFNTKEVFNRYTENKDLKEANIFHLYDTGKECIKDNSGYCDARHFDLIAFNTRTLEKRNLGRHDSINSFGASVPFDMARVYADGSFFIRFSRNVKIDNNQTVSIS